MTRITLVALAMLSAIATASAQTALPTPANPTATATDSRTLSTSNPRMLSTSDPRTIEEAQAPRGTNTSPFSPGAGSNGLTTSVSPSTARP